MAPPIRWNMVLSPQRLILLMVKGRADKSNIKCYQSFLSQNKTETKENHNYFPQVRRFLPPHPQISRFAQKHTHQKYSHLHILTQSTANILNGANGSFFRIQNPSCTLTIAHKWHKLLINSIKNSYSVYIAAAMLGLCQQLAWFFNSINV